MTKQYKQRQTQIQYKEFYATTNKKDELQMN